MGVETSKVDDATDVTEHVLHLSLVSYIGRPQICIRVDDWHESTSSTQVFADAVSTAGTWRSEQRDEDASKVLSISLQNALFSAEGLEQKLQSDLDTFGAVRLILEMGDPRLHDLPWELAGNPRLFGRGQQKDTTPNLLIEVRGLSMVRASAGITTPQAMVEGPVNVAMAFGRLADEAHAEAQGLAIQDLVVGLGDARGLQLFPSSAECTLDDAMGLLAKDAHVFAFLGHSSSSGLHFDDGTFSVNELRNRFDSRRYLRVVVLAACNTGRVGPGSDIPSWNGLSVPNVVLMQRDISLEEAKRFLGEFLKALGETGNIDRAMWAGREAISSQVDRATPVIYMKRGASPRIVTQPEPPRSTGPDEIHRQNSTPIVRAMPQPGLQTELVDFLLEDFHREVIPAKGHLRAITPYFGPGALQVGVEVNLGLKSLEEIWWDPVLPPYDGAAEVDSLLEEEGALELAEFLRGLVAERQGQRPVVSRPPDYDAPEQDSTVRLAVARLAHASNELLLGSLNTGTTPLSSLERSLVPVPADPEHPVNKALDAAIKVCPSRRGTGRDLLRADRIGTRLQAVKRELSQTHQLSWGTGMWLTDLLWHVIICDSPVYPFIEELAMQVSILQGEPSRPIRRLEPSSAMSPGTDDLGALRDACALAVSRGFDASEPPESARRKLYTATGELLRNQYREWEIHGHKKDWWGQPRAAALALTTTFDLEIERGLASGGRPFHVALPVYVTSDPSFPGGTDDIRWLVGTFQCRSENPTIEELTTVSEDWQTLSSLATQSSQGANLLGPMVIKLNGSPLHEIPRRWNGVKSPPLSMVNGSAVRSSRSRLEGQGSYLGARTTAQRPSQEESSWRDDMQHAIALGELDFLQAMRTSLWSIDSGVKGRPDSGMPPWLCTDLLTRNRYWVLIGHRLADWSSRTQIFTLLMNDDQLLRGNLNRGFVVARDFDRDRLRFHEWLGLKRTVGDAGLLADAFRELFNDQGDPE